MKSILTIILIALMAAPGFSQKKADLSYNLKMNTVYRIKSSTVQNTTQTIMGNTQEVQTNTVSVFSLKPLKQVEEDMIVEVRFDTTIMNISQPPMEINSSEPGDLNSSDPGEILECIMNRMSNSAFLVKMTNTGKVAQFMNLEPVVDGIMQGTDSLQGQMAGFVMQRAEMMLDKKALTTMIESVTAYLPGTTTKVGGKWESNILVSGGGMDMKQNTIYKLEKLENNTATIVGDIVVESVPGTVEMNGAQITPDLRGLGKTEFTIDTDTGWFLKGTTKQQITGEMGVNAQGNALTIPMEINTEINVEAR